MGNGTWEKQPAASIVASNRNGTIHTGATSHLLGRICQHREGVKAGYQMLSFISMTDGGLRIGLTPSSG